MLLGTLDISLLGKILVDKRAMRRCYPSKWGDNKIRTVFLIDNFLTNFQMLKYYQNDMQLS